MDTNDTQTCITGGMKKYRNDLFYTKNSVAEAPSDYDAQFNDAPTQSKSRAALILTEVEEQLEVNESEYNNVKYTFDYIKRLYMGAGTNPSEITDFKPADEMPITETISTREITLNSLMDDEKGSDYNEAFEERQYYDFDTENAREDDSKQDETEPTEQSPHYSARSYIVSPRQDIYLGVQDENSSDSSPQNYFSEEASGEEKKNVVLEEPPEDAVIDDDVQIDRDDGFSGISTSRQHPYQIHLAEYSKNIHEDSRDAGDSLLDQDQEIYSNNLPGSARNEEGKKPELFLNLSGSVESVQITPAKNKKSRSEKHRKGSVTSTNKKNFNKQVDDTLCGVTKIRRKKRRLKASNSRSTTATRDTCFPAENKKDVRKRKQRGHATMPTSQSTQRRHEIAAKLQQNWSEVVEIYHNRAVKSGSLSVVSSKHSRLETRGRSAVSANTYDQRSEIKDPHLFAGCDDQSTSNLIDTKLQRSLKSPKNSPRIHGEENDTQSKMYYQALPDATDLRSGEPNRTELIYNAERSTIPNASKTHDQFNGCHHHHYHRNTESPVRSSAYYDPMATRNYELPTVASKMKRVNRSYFNRFNFRNIPFVVGTSVTPSYNLGLNIQETLSLIKTRQRMPGGVTPLLISKVSKGVRPVSTLLGCVGDQDEIPVEESGTQFDEQRLHCTPNAQLCFDTQQSCAKTIEVPSTKKRKTQSICSSMKLHSQKNAESHLQLTQSALLRQRQEELNIGDSQSTNMNGIREVLVNFHDQFEAMNIKYEKLQEQAEKSNDESLKKELATLEKDLSAKEEEINAVVNLYKEVMALKQQMKLLHERNSLVCVATESPGSPMYPQISSRAETANPILNLYRPSGSGNSRGPSTSTRLAGLLRQIKIFQKQLK